MGEWLSVQPVECLHTEVKWARHLQGLSVGRTPSEPVPRPLHFAVSGGQDPNPAEFRRDVIFCHPRSDQRPPQRIDGPLRALIPHFEMKMGPETSARIAAPPDCVASPKAERLSRRTIECPRLSGILRRLQPFLNGGVELGQMRVHRGQALAIEVKRQAIARIGHLDPADPAGLGREDRHPLHPAGPDVHARVEMAGPDLSEVAAELKGNGQGRVQRVLSEQGHAPHPPHRHSHPAPPNSGAIHVHTPSHVCKLPSGLQPPSPEP